MTLPRVQPIPPTWHKEPFDDPDWLFDFKYDGFRAICVHQGALFYEFSLERRVGSTPPASLPSASSPELAKCIAYIPCRISLRKHWRYSSATSLSSSITRMLTVTPRLPLLSGAGGS